MEVDGPTPYTLGLLLLPLLAVLLMALCARCRDLPTSYDDAPANSESQWNRGNILIKSSCECTAGPPAACAGGGDMTGPWPPISSYPPVISCPPLSPPDQLHIPRSPQPPGGSHRMPSSRQNSDDANSVASYENQEPACEDADDNEDEEDYSHTDEGYLVVLPDGAPATSTAVPTAPVPSNPSLRDSAFSMESGEDYVNVPESEESAEASLDGSREYVNVSQELPSTAARTKPAALSSQEVGDEEEEEAPDYENLQELN